MGIEESKNKYKKRVINKEYERDSTTRKAQSVESHVLEIKHVAEQIITRFLRRINPLP